MSGSAAATAAADDPTSDDPRIPIWRALSDLYLDTDVSLFYSDIAETLAASPFTLDALRDILIEDVHPALYGNLLIVAGEWAGFEDEWLLPRIAETRRRPRWRRRLTRVFAGSVFDDWREVAARIEAIRAAANMPAASNMSAPSNASDHPSERVSP